MHVFYRVIVIFAVIEMLSAAKAVCDEIFGLLTCPTRNNNSARTSGAKLMFSHVLHPDFSLSSHFTVCLPLSSLLFICCRRTG